MQQSWCEIVVMQGRNPVIHKCCLPQLAHSHIITLKACLHKLLFFHIYSPMFVSLDDLLPYPDPMTAEMCKHLIVDGRPVADM